jgi:ketosteroid isomerase-like protein
VVRVVSAGEDLALVYNDWRMSAKGRDGKPMERTGKAVEVVRRQADGTWRFAIDDPYARG